MHVVAGKFLAEDVVGTYQARTIIGRMLAIQVRCGEALVNGSKVIATDIETSNGVIHVIDTVITK